VGVLPLPTLVALAAVPYALQVTRGLRSVYDQPYGLMPVMATNIKLHLVTGVLLFTAYLAVIGIGAVAPSTNLYLG
jgi:hypothetical protein